MKKIKIIYPAIILLILVICAVIPANVFAEGDEIDPGYFKSIMDTLKTRYGDNVTDKQLVEGAVKGLFGSMDKYSEYFTNSEMERFSEQIDGKYFGIGVMIERIDDYIVVSKVFAGSPAEKAGIIEGDRLVEAAGKSLVGISTEEAASTIKGEKGTKVKIIIMREGLSDTLDIEVTREPIEVNPVTFEIRNDVGYLKLDIFNANAVADVTKALEAFDSKNIKKVILDLRNNPGGSVDQAVGIAKKFVPEGLIAKLDFKDPEQQDQVYYSDLKEKKYKLVVLVNEMSASASEIVSGAIQDTKSGVLVGTKTFGKSRFQDMFPILTPEAYKNYQNKLGVKVIDGYQLIKKYNVEPTETEIMGWGKLTEGFYYTPSNKMIDKVGLTPDYTVEMDKQTNDINVNSVRKLSKTNKLGLKAQSVDVFNAEKMLKILGYKVNGSDMNLDEVTFDAIKAFQKDSKLYPYGVLDITTQKALNEKFENSLKILDKQYNKAIEVINN